MLHTLLLLALQTPILPESGEVHLRNIRQLTFGGENAEAYFSSSGRQLIFQRTASDSGCDQQYIMNVDGSAMHRVSSGAGRTTCGYFFARDTRIFYASTEHGGRACPPRPDYSHGYVWALFDYDIYVADSSGEHARRLTDNPRYDPERTVPPPAPRFLPRLGGGSFRLRHLRRRLERRTRAPSNRQSRLRRRRHVVARRPDHSLHVAAQRRSRHLHHAHRRQPSAPADAHVGVRRRALLLPRRQTDRVSRVPSCDRAGLHRLPRDTRSV